VVDPRRLLSRLRPLAPYRGEAAIALLAVAIAAATVGALVAGDRSEDTGAVPEAGGRAQGERGTSFLARIVPPPADETTTAGPRVPRTVSDLVRRLPLERKVAQLFLIGFPALAPFAQERLRERAIGDVHRALYERDDVLLAASAREVETLRAFILQHDGVIVEPRVYLAGRTFTIYQLRRAAGVTS